MQIEVCKSKIHKVTVTEANLGYLDYLIEQEGGSSRVAAVLVETVVGSNGIIPPPTGYLEGLRDLCDKWELLLIVDETMTGMGRTNDAILYGGTVHLFVDATDEEAKDLAEKMPSNTSSDYGRPFGEIFKSYEYDFFKIDPMLFSPAKVIITNTKSGKSFTAGELNAEVIKKEMLIVLEETDKVEYVAIVDRAFNALDTIEIGNTIILVAAWVGKPRLIDNMWI